MVHDPVGVVVPHAAAYRRVDFFMRQMQGGAGRAMSFGRSRARMLNQEQGKVTFDDVAGVDEAKEELSEVSTSSPIRASSPVLAGAFPRRPARRPSRYR